MDEKQLDNPRPYALTLPVAIQAGVTDSGDRAMQWHYSVDRIKSELKITDDAGPLGKLTKRLAHLLTMESVARTVDRFGLDKLHPDVKLYFKYEGKEVRDFTKAVEWILKNVEATDPSDADLLLRDIEYSRMSADEQVVAEVLDDFFSRSRQRGVEILLAHEWRKVAASWRKEAWLAIRSAIQERPPTSHVTKHDLEVSVLWKVNLPTDTLLVRNTSGRVLQDVTLVLEHSTDGNSRIAGYHVATWEAGRAYALKIRDETLNIAPQRTREAVPVHLVIADAIGPAINASLSQCPASRFSPDFPGYQEIILEDVAPVFEPPALLRRVQSLIADHNVVMAGIRKAIKAEQSTLRRAKRRMDKDQLALFEADVVKVSHNELPASFHLEQSQRARSSREDLVSRLASLKSVAKTSALESMADYVDDVLQSVSSQKPLAAIAIAGDSKVDATTRPLPLIAQSNLETFIQIAESRLHTIEGKIASNIERQSPGEQRQRLEEIRRLRQAGQLPDWCRESESAYFRDLDAKFRNSLQRLPERAGPGESHVTRASILAEYEARYAKLLSNSVAQ